MATIFRVLLAALLLAANSQPQIIIIAKKKAGGGGGGTVTFDVAGAGTTAFSGTTIAADHTVTNALTNTVVLGLLSWQNGGAAGGVTSCTYNGNAMTELWDFRETDVGLQGTAAYIYANGTGDGTAHSLSCTVSANITGNGGLTLTTISASGANQSTPNRTPVTDSITATSTLSITVSDAVSGDLVVDGISIYGETAAPTTTQTSRQTFANVGGNSWSAAVSTAAASGSTNMGYGFSANERYAAIGAVAIRP